jgi:TetR/AcrR family transcriptional regulator, lmrAB and yxaGH operons repressor
MVDRTLTRTRMIEAAARLFRRQGYAATGWRAVVAEAGTPWGSAYHCFPGGKQELAVEAVRLSGARVSEQLDRALADCDEVAEGVLRWFGYAGGHLRDSGYVEGCPIATVALEATGDEQRVADACAAQLQHWTDTLRDALVASGRAPDDAAERATLVVSALEGALITARLRRDPAPVTLAARAAAELLRRP